LIAEKRDVNEVPTKGEAVAGAILLVLVHAGVHVTLLARKFAVKGGVPAP
jgi:hypothetical protein